MAVKLNTSWATLNADTAWIASLEATLNAPAASIGLAAVRAIYVCPLAPPFRYKPAAGTAL
eukprot:gene7638-34568_t